MQIRVLLTVFCIFSSTYLFANPLVDSVGVENYKGKEVVIHKIEPKDTYYQLSRKYNIPVPAIMQFNASVALHPGMTVKIPTERPFGQAKSQPATETPVAASADALVEYKVGPKETLYAIAKRFNTTIEDIKETNNLKGNNLSAGQMIKVRQKAPGQPPATASAETRQTPPPVTAPAPQAPAPKTVLAPPDTSSATEQENKARQNRYGLSEHDERGVGVWIDDENLDGSKMLALHRTIPPGRVIKVTNPMTGISAYVKVIGKFTENETTKDVIIVVTKAVADRIGILDKRFQINIFYGVE